MNRRSKIALALIAALFCGQATLLAKLDYAKAWFERLDFGEAIDPRGPQGPLALGTLHWDPRFYVGQPALAPFAALARSECPGSEPLKTAICLSNVMAIRFPHGRPSHELFDANFDPARALTRHLNGEPGHCVSRSGILATALLASGIPARVVQLYPPSGHVQEGHNAIEVYDPAQGGWIFFDPTYGGRLESQTGARSAAGLVVAAGALRWIPLAMPASYPPQPFDGAVTFSGAPTPRFSGHIVYPEPWLYTRVGKKQAPAIFSGTFLSVGPRSLRLAWGHWLLDGSIAVTGLAFLAVLVVAITRRHRTMAPTSAGVILRDATGR